MAKSQQSVLAIVESFECLAPPSFSSVKGSRLEVKALKHAFTVRAPAFRPLTRDEVAVTVCPDVYCATCLALHSLKLTLPEFVFASSSLKEAALLRLLHDLVKKNTGSPSHCAVNITHLQEEQYLPESLMVDLHKYLMGIIRWRDDHKWIKNDRSLVCLLAGLHWSKTQPGTVDYKRTAHAFARNYSLSPLLRKVFGVSYAIDETDSVFMEELSSYRMDQLMSLRHQLIWRSLRHIVITIRAQHSTKGVAVTLASLGQPPNPLPDYVVDSDYDEHDPLENEK